MLTRDSLGIKLFADGADLPAMIKMAEMPYISGLTTNPTLMNKAGITNFEKFAKSVLKEITFKPISFEVFSDELEEMKNQALTIASWGDNIYVKIPVTNTRGDSTKPTVEYLSNKGVKLNITAIMTKQQVSNVMEVLNTNIPSYVSVFAGRIADTGVDPIPVMRECLREVKKNQNAELIWASPRELLNVVQANEIGCHIITATQDILNKLNLIGKDLDEYSLETVAMFFNDAKNSGFAI